MSIIEVKNLKKTYEYYKKSPGFVASLKSVFKRKKLFAEAVKGVSFSIKEGEIVGFLGSNGAGKTTTLKMLSGILYPTSGEVSVMGFTPWKRQKAFQKQFALVMGQKNQLWWDLPAMESFLLNKAIYQIPDKQFDDMLEELTTLLDVKDILDVQVRKLSLGQRMKCELIAALLHNPRVLFLDEPTIGLDVVSQQHVRSFLKNYNEKFNTTIILTSHDMDDIEALCERVILVDHGSIIFDDALDTLKATYITEKELVVTFTKDMTQQKLEKYGTIKEHTPRRTVFSVPKDESKQIAAKIITEEPIDDILINEPDVEHIIRHLFASS